MVVSQGCRIYGQVERRPIALLSRENASSPVPKSDIRMAYGGTRSISSLPYSCEENIMKYAAMVALIVLAFALNYAGASWVGLVHHNVASTDSAGFATPQVVARVLPDWAVALFPVTILFVATALGILVRILWEPGEGSFWKKLWRGIKALFLTPLVLYPAFSVATQNPDAIVATLFAFQNGFFWQSILQGKSFSPDAKK
jgi:hypothetical protein